jgi:hypothetical protein
LPVTDNPESDPRKQEDGAYTEEDAKKIEERLRSLGYVD